MEPVDCVKEAVDPVDCVGEAVDPVDCVGEDLLEAGMQFIFRFGGGLTTESSSLSFSIVESWSLVRLGLVGSLMELMSLISFISFMRLISLRMPPIDSLLLFWARAVLRMNSVVELLVWPRVLLLSFSAVLDSSCKYML